MTRTIRRVILGLSCTSLIALAQTAPDNSKVNRTDQSTKAPTADQQAETKTDRELAKKIRKSVTQDKTLSTYAHNVKIIVRAGVVTLRGPVRDEAERTSIQAKAAEIAGAGNVHNEITIAPKKS